MRPQQEDLFCNPQAEAALETIIRRLPRKTFILVSDVATATDVSAMTVYSWVEAGDVVSIPFQSSEREKNAYRLYRDSVIGLMAARLGIARRRLLQLHPDLQLGNQQPGEK